MKKLSLTLSAVALLALPMFSHASTNDHMTCYKVKDSSKFAANVSMDSIGGAFDSTCTVGKAAFLCIPSTKTVNTFTVDDAPATLTPITSHHQNEITLCYKVKCPANGLQAQSIQDQFGAHVLGGMKTSMICGPASNVAPVCMAPDAAQCSMLQSCTGGICSTSRSACSVQSDCPASPPQQCCCDTGQFCF